MCGNMPPTILIPCVNRGLAPLCLGLYYTKSQRERWFEHDLIRLNKRRSKAEKIERDWAEQRRLWGGQARASADVIEISILGSK